MKSKYQRLILTLDTLKDFNDDSQILCTLCIRLTFITMTLPFLGEEHSLRLSETKQIPNLETWNIPWITQVFLYLLKRRLNSLSWTSLLHGFTHGRKPYCQKLRCQRLSCVPGCLCMQAENAQGDCTSSCFHQLLEVEYFWNGCVNLSANHWELILQPASPSVHFQLRLVVHWVSTNYWTKP